jgi:hypothetical protein
LIKGARPGARQAKGYALFHFLFKKKEEEGATR